MRVWLPGLILAVGILLAVEADHDATGSLGGNPGDGRHFPPLHRAAREGNLEEMDKLLGVGADMSAQDEAGWTPLHWAAYMGRLEAVRALIAAGADKHATCDRGLTAVHLSARKGHHDCMRALLAAGDGADANDKDDRKLLRWAAFNGYDSTVNSLLSRGVDDQDEAASRASQSFKRFPSQSIDALHPGGNPGAKR